MANVFEPLARVLRPMISVSFGEGEVVAEAKAPAATPERGQRAKSGYYTLDDILVMSDEIEYLDDMRPPKRFATIDKMLADGSVWAATMAWIMPMLSTSMQINPGSRDPADIVIADFIRDDLTNLSTDLQQIRYESLMCIAYGVTMHELVWDFREDKKWHLRDMAYIPPASIGEQGWRLEDDGSPKGVEQLAPGIGEPIFVPIEKLLIHTHGQLGANYTGRSALRAAYKPWWYKDKLEAIAAVAVERNAAGIPVGKQLGDAHKGGAVARYIEAVLKAVRTHQAAFVRETSEFEFRLEGVKGQTISPEPFLIYHSIEIFRSMLAQHVALGGTGTGSWALADSDIDFLVMALEAVLNARDAAFNRHVIPRWINYNWKNVPRASYPKATHTPLNTRKLKDWFEAMERAVNTGAIPTSKRLTAMSEDILGIAAPSPTATEPETQDELDAEQPADGTEPEPAKVAAARAIVRAGDHVRTKAEDRRRDAARRPEQRARARDREKIGDACTVCGSTAKLTAHHVDGVNGSSEVQTVCKGCHDEWSGFTQEGGGAKRITASALASYRRSAGRVANAAPLASVGIMAEAGVAPNFVRMADGLDNARDRIIARVGALQAKQAKRLAAIGIKLIKAGDAEGVAAILTGERIAAGKRFVPFDEEEAAFAEELEGVYGDGFDEIWYEVRGQGVPADDVEAPAGEDVDSDRGMLGAWAMIAAVALADRMSGAWASESLRQIGAGVADEKALYNFLTGSTTGLLKGLASGYVNAAFGLGRGTMTKANEKILDHTILTAVMDGVTCEPCAETDGTMYSASQTPSTPLYWCLGADRCRCQGVPVVNDTADRSEPLEEGETPPEWF